MGSDRIAGVGWNHPAFAVSEDQGTLGSAGGYKNLRAHFQNPKTKCFVFGFRVGQDPAAVFVAGLDNIEKRDQLGSFRRKAFWARMGFTVGAAIAAPCPRP